MTRPPTPIDEPHVHDVLGALRDDRSAAEPALEQRVAQEVRRLDVPQPGQNPGILRVATSALLQALNLILGAVRRRPEPQPERSDDDDS